MFIPILAVAVSAFTSLFFPSVPEHYKATQWPLAFTRQAPSMQDSMEVVAVTDTLGKVHYDTISTAAGTSFVTEHIEGIDPRFEPVIGKLVADGWSEVDVRTMFADTRVTYIPRLVRVPIRKTTGSGGGSSSAYSWVNTKESAEACRVFLERYAPIFDQAEAKYNVDREVIAALMRCETQHGKVTGDYHVFSVYATMALMNDSAAVATNLAQADTDLKQIKASADRSREEIDRIKTRSASKANWAYKELKALLQMKSQRQIDALDLRGSWAGAFGWSQFLPSSYLRIAVDGDGDNRIDLFNPADAIHSVARYLSDAGFKSTDKTRISKALWSYNNSSAYVESIMALAERVKANANASAEASTATTGNR